jgi:hypothetical protein
MPPRRAPLSAINVDLLSYHKELSPSTRGVIISQSQAGQEPAKIARDTGVPDTTVRRTINQSIPLYCNRL